MIKKYFCGHIKASFDVLFKDNRIVLIGIEKIEALMPNGDWALVNLPQDSIEINFIKKDIEKTISSSILP